MIVAAAWFKAFLITTAAELLLAFPLLGRERARVRRAGTVVFAQLASHPMVWFVWPEFGLRRPAYLLVAEFWAFAIEALVYRLVFPDLPLRRAAAISALANAGSLTVGLLLRG